jgi:hypothetical protein
VLNTFGGKYNNFAIGYRRMYVWVIDAYNQEILNTKLTEYIGYFIKSVAVIPTIAFLLSLIAFVLMPKTVTLSFRSELILISSHILMISLYGYYSRRLTLPITILLFLISIKMFFCLKNNIQVKVMQLWLFVTVFFIVCSWIYTPGPLV